MIGKKFGVISAGFIVGVIAGFVYGQGARKATASNVTTNVDGAKVQVEIDLGGIAAGGITGYLRDNYDV